MMNQGDINLHYDITESTLTTQPKQAGLPMYPLNSITSQLQHVTTLEIIKCGLSEIPSSIQSLKLVHLVVRDNKLKTVPSCLYTGLKDLKRIDFSGNYIKSFEVEPACHGVLETIDLSRNQITNFPQWILTAPCPHLKSVDYSCNFLTNLIVSRDLNIERLVMCNCLMNDSDFKFLMRIKNIHFLNIGNERNVERYDNSFKDLNRLFGTVAWLSIDSLILNNLMISIIPKNLFYLESLKQLELVDCDLNWIPEDIAYLKNLQALDVSENSICSLPEELWMLEHLEILKAAFNCISKIKGVIKNLKLLDLYSNELESFNFDMNCFDLIDLERNRCAIIDFEFYQDKKNQMRLQYGLNNRMDGQIVIESSDSDSYSSSSNERSSDDSVIYNGAAETIEEVFESWDSDEERLKPNPEITDSDNEWQGNEDVLRPRKIPFDCNRDMAEDWIFIDAD